jgi:hypothetical protein
LILHSKKEEREEEEKKVGVTNMTRSGETNELHGSFQYGQL